MHGTGTQRTNTEGAEKRKREHVLLVVHVQPVLTTRSARREYHSSCQELGLFVPLIHYSVGPVSRRSFTPSPTDTQEKVRWYETLQNLSVQ